MSGGELPVVSAATAYDPDERIGTIVLVIGSAAFDDRIEADGNVAQLALSCEEYGESRRQPNEMAESR
jgi:hypothetical protein